MEKKIEILASFDDGHKDDSAIAEMALKYNIPTVFYIPGNAELREGQIERLAGHGTCHLCPIMEKLFDIGAHTLTHPQDLKILSREDAVKEIAGSKDWLEKIIGRPVTRFCYPRGRFNEETKDIVKEAGFKMARTTRVNSIDFSEDPFETNTTVHVHPDRKEYEGKSWLELAYEHLDNVIENGGRFELWGHSWEVSNYNMWEFLDDCFYYMDKRMKEIDYKREIKKL